MTERKTILTPNFAVACLELEEHVANGWRVDPENFPCTLGTNYEITLCMEAGVEVVESIPGVATMVDFVQKQDTTDGGKNPSKRPYVKKGT